MRNGTLLVCSFVNVLFDFCPRLVEFVADAEL